MRRIAEVAVDAGGRESLESKIRLGKPILGRCAWLQHIFSKATSSKNSMYFPNSAKLPCISQPQRFLAACPCFTSYPHFLWELDICVYDVVLNGSDSMPPLLERLF